MNWLRDNILKILIILGVVIVFTVIAVLLFKPKNDEDVVSGSKYGEIETKLQNAAIKYIESHKKLLPATTENVTTLKLSTLQSNNYIGKLAAIEKPSVSCTGYVEISKLYEDKNAYKYRPFITCGEYYTTRTISEYIKDIETKNGTFERTSDDGLYKMGDELIYRGEKVNNYIKIGDRLYRIIKIDKDNHLELISIDNTDRYIWDDRYNIDRNRYEGINTFMKSRIHDTLTSIYEDETENAFFTARDKSFIISHDFCIGKRSTGDSNIYSGVECNETTPMYVGLITPNEYARASIDPNCNSLFDASCTNYNYFNYLGPRSNNSYLTLTGVAENSYEVFVVNNSDVRLVRASSSSTLHYVIYLNEKTIYSVGTGTLTDPYIVR